VPLLSVLSESGCMLGMVFCLPGLVARRTVLLYMERIRTHAVSVLSITLQCLWLLMCHIAGSACMLRLNCCVPPTQHVAAFRCRHTFLLLDALRYQPGTTVADLLSMQSSQYGTPVSCLVVSAAVAPAGGSRHTLPAAAYLGPCGPRWPLNWLFVTALMCLSRVQVQSSCWAEHGVAAF
jgi:hypothetical protein